MKRLFSMLLVVTILVTTLMGVMIVDVNAAVTKTSVEITPNETAVGGRTVTITMGSAEVPTGSTNVGAKMGIASGSVYFVGHKYDTTLAKAGTTTLAAAGKYDPVNFLDVIKDGKVLGQDTVKLDFKAVTIQDDTSWAANAKITGNYLRLAPFVKDGTTSLSNTKRANTISKADANAMTDKQAMLLTFYAYATGATSGTGSVLGIQVNNDSSAWLNADLGSAQIKSEVGVPHKVDVVIYKDDTHWHEQLFVDGIARNKNTTARKLDTLTLKAAFNPYFSLTFDSAKSESAGPYKYTIADVDWTFIGGMDDAITMSIVNKEDVAANLIVVPEFDGEEANKFRTDDYITGVDAAFATDLKAVLETKAAGDRIVEVYASKYSDPAKLFTGESNVKLINKTTGAEVAVADATGTMDDYLFMVNGIYVSAKSVADPLPYQVASGTVFKTGAHNSITTRTKHENYISNEYTDEKAFGGLTSGFYRYTNEPRSSVGFTSGTIKYNESGYVGMNAYNNNPSVNVTSAALTKYPDAAKNIATAEFDMYIPEYTPTSSDAFRIALSFFNDGWANSNRYSDKNIYFTTGGIKGHMTTSGYTPYIVDVKPNTWNTVSIQFDMEAAKVDGLIDCNVYVNGVLAQSFDIGTDKVKFDNEAETHFAPIAFMRFYSPKYISYGVTPGAWYMGDYTPTATPVSAGKISTSDSKVTVIEDELLIASAYATEAELISALSDYVPVYATAMDIATVNAKYDEVDGKITSKTSGTNYIHTGIIIKRLCDLAGWFDITVDPETGKNIYTVKSSEADIVSAVDNGDGTATLTVKNTFSFTDTVEGAYHDVASLVAENPELKTDTLIGFAVVEEGKLPKVYSLAASGLELRDINYNVDTGNAELSYRKYGAVENALSFQFVVAAYNEKGKMLALKPSTSFVIDSTTADGTNVLTFAPEFTAEVNEAAARYKVFVFDSFASRIPVFRSVKVDK